MQCRRDGKELFYIAPDNRFMAVPIRLAPGRPAIESDAPFHCLPPVFGERGKLPQAESTSCLRMGGFL